jgi:hypothetical protein
MDYNELIKHFGDQGKAAKALDVSQAAVSHWRKGIPKLRQYQIAAVIAAETPPIAPETAIPATIANRETAPYLAAIKPFYTLTNAEIEAMGTKLGVEPRRGETWSEFRDRLLTCGR